LQCLTWFQMKVVFSKLQHPFKWSFWSAFNWSIDESSSFKLHMFTKALGRIKFEACRSRLNLNNVKSKSYIMI
jgi:hypothetical protein